VGDRVIAWLEEQTYYDDKTCYLWPQQLPESACLIYDWGDGTPPEVSYSGWVGRHSYENPGTYTVTLTLTDLQGGVGTASQTITILP